MKKKRESKGKECKKKEGARAMVERKRAGLSETQEGSNTLDIRFNLPGTGNGQKPRARRTIYMLKIVNIYLRYGSQDWEFRALDNLDQEPAAFTFQLLFFELQELSIGFVFLIH